MSGEYKSKLCTHSFALACDWPIRTEKEEMPATRRLVVETQRWSFSAWLAGHVSAAKCKTRDP
eukprot:6198269-Pleurochrysis_carterae.AAC.1